MTREQFQTWITFECDVTHLEMKMNSVSIIASYRLSTKFCITHSLFHIWHWFLWNHEKCQQNMTREELQTWITYEKHIRGRNLKMNWLSLVASYRLSTKFWITPLLSMFGGEFCGIVERENKNWWKKNFKHE